MRLIVAANCYFALRERGEDRGKVAESFNVNRTTLYRALAG